MVSYIYTKTALRFLIETPQKILLKIKEMDSLGSNFYGWTVTFEPSALGSESFHGSCLLSIIK